MHMPKDRTIDKQIKNCIGRKRDYRQARSLLFINCCVNSSQAKDEHG